MSALSSRLEVETVVEGLLHRAVFEQGKVVERPDIAGATSRRGTRIRFHADETIFGDATFDLPTLKVRLIELAWLIPTLHLTFQGRALDKPEGLMGWVSKLQPDVVRETLLTGKGEHKRVGVEFALGWSPSLERPVTRPFVNYLEMHQGGTHLEGVQRALLKSTKARALKQNGFVCVVHVTLLDPKFGGPTRARLESPLARVAVQRVMKATLDASPWFWDRIHEIHETK